MEIIYLILPHLAGTFSFTCNICKGIYDYNYRISIYPIWQVSLIYNNIKVTVT